MTHIVAKTQSEAHIELSIHLSGRLADSGLLGGWVGFALSRLDMIYHDTIGVGHSSFRDRLLMSTRRVMFSDLGGLHANR